MKLKLLLLSLLFCGAAFSQATVSISGPTTVSVGSSTNFTATFNPINYPDAHPVIDTWSIQITANSLGHTGNIAGYLYTTTNHTEYIAVNNPSGTSINIPLQFGDGSNTRDVYMIAKASGKYVDNNTGAFIAYFNFVTAEKDFVVNRINAPNINGNATAVNCLQTDAVYSASGQTYASSYQWSVTNGAAIIGSSTGNSVTVRPPLSGNFNVICRALGGGSSLYFKETVKNITRVQNPIAINTIPATQNYFCKTTGLVFQIENIPNISSVAWTAPGCTVSAESIVGTKRQVTITPLNTTANGTSVAVYATATFTGGCTSVTPTKSYFVYESGQPPVPQGYIEVGDWECFQETAISMTFVPTGANPFVNGVISMSPSYMAHPFRQRNFNVTITYTNPCSGLRSTLIIPMSTPAPCIEPGSRMAEEQYASAKEVSIYPNPTAGKVTVELPEISSGSFYIFSQENMMLQEGSFKDSNSLKLNLSEKLKSGIYIIKIVTDKEITTQKIILK